MREFFWGEVMGLFCVLVVAVVTRSCMGDKFTELSTYKRVIFLLHVNIKIKKF